MQVHAKFLEFLMYSGFSSLKVAKYIDETDFLYTLLSHYSDQYEDKPI